MKPTIQASIKNALRVIEELSRPDSIAFIEAVAIKIADCLANGNKILVAGNGGSLCDSCHFAEELSGYFRAKRRALAAIALSDPGHLTCVANDTSFDLVFARAIEALGKEGDLFVALSTSGNSRNLIKAVQEAKRKKLFTVALLGKGGGELAQMSDLEFIIKTASTSDRIQEAHMTLLHILVELVEERLFGKHGQMEEPKEGLALSLDA